MAGIDFYSFTLATDSDPIAFLNPGTPIRIRDGSFKFMRGQVYRFIVAPGGSLAGHPFELVHNGSLVVANGTSDSISGNLTVNILVNQS